MTCHRSSALCSQHKAKAGAPAKTSKFNKYAFYARACRQRRFLSGLVPAAEAQVR
jgi:hypothetical protein